MLCLPGFLRGFLVCRREGVVICIDIHTYCGYAGYIMYVFLDESGDLSFGDGSSRYFVAACLVTEDVLGARRIAQKVFRGFLRKTKKKRKGEMLHATKETPQTRKKIYSIHCCAQKIKSYCADCEKGRHP